MDKEEKYLEYKGLGNSAFKEQQYASAIEKYSLAIEEIENDEGKYNAALAILHSNRAQCQLKLENYGLVIEDCTKSIKYDNKFLKSYYRRAIANYAISELEVALKDLKTAKTISPKDSKINSLFNEISKELRIQKFEAAIDVVERSIFSTIDYSHLDCHLEVEQMDGTDGDVSIKNMSRSYIDNMIKLFKDGKNLDKGDAFAIVNAANSIFKTEKSLVEIGWNDEKIQKITVCGDTHGQFYDVLNIFQKFGDASDDHVYLFNGDFVDRGSWSCEVALLLYSLKVLYPKKVFINRGNHETDDMNHVYGFKDECKYKYNEKLFKCFSESFGSLPYCTLINSEYLVMHGGLFSEDNVKIDDLKKINRFKNHKGQPPKKGLQMELLWTDPQIGEGRSLSKRGIGMQFGPDITAAFCEANGLKGVIRSHEVRQNGYEWEHNGKLCTVFSAPNYCDAQGNLGGVIEFHRTGEMKCHSFEAVPHPDIPPMNYTKNQFGF